MLIRPFSGTRRDHLQTQEQAALRDAFIHQIEISRIAVRMPEAPAARLPLAAVGENGGAEGRLRSLPGRPGLAFDEIDFLELLGAGLIEIARRREPPLVAHLFEIARDSRLRHVERAGDGFLRPPLQIHIGHLPAPLPCLRPLDRIDHIFVLLFSLSPIARGCRMGFQPVRQKSKNQNPNV